MSDSPTTRPSFPSRTDDHSRTFHQYSDAAPAICRICRGEGTSAEPLFYPCKCSGSIKYVHQDCLMEWLSHSQKKYCELCKTSFRFTKLYAPDMPQSLPVHIFLEHMLKYVVRNLLVWLRAVVTISVWVCWLPYFMRVVWAFMFWISDEGLGAGTFVTRQPANRTVLDPDTLGEVGTCAANPLVSHGVGFDSQITFLNSSNESLPPTLLSDVSFLRNLTRSLAVNRTVITVVEGQIITILVIVCFILVILVRDYVVQQQPEINMRAAFADQENNPNAPAQVDDLDIEVEDGRESDELESDDETVGTSGHANSSLGLESEPLTHTGPGADVLDKLPDLIAAEIGVGSESSTTGHELDKNSTNQATVIDYLRIYRRADGNLDRVLEIVEEEGLADELGYWVEITRRSIRERENASQDVRGSTVSKPSTPSNASPGMDEIDAQGSSSSYQASTQNQPKGKEREWLPISPELSPTPTPPAVNHGYPVSSSRPRARSDGPDPPSIPNPLGNNNWSFANLQVADEAERNIQTRSPNHQSSIPEATASVDGGSIMRQRAGDSESLGHSEHDADDVSVDGLLVASPNAVQDEPVIAEPQQRGLVGHVANFMWGDLDQNQETAFQEEEAAAAAGADPVMENGAHDPWADHDPIAEPIDVNVDPNVAEVDAAAAVAGMDAEAMEDLEDFEGVMELLGMRGPIAGLFQNAIFCSVLVSVTIFACIFVPYNIGRVTVWTVANPIQLVRMFMELSKLIQDAAVMMGGFGSWCALNIVDMFTGIVGGAMGSKVVSARKAAWGLWTGAGSRVVEYALMDFPLTASEVQNFSAVSHEALNSMKGGIGWAFGQVDNGIASLTLPDLMALFDGRFLARLSAGVNCLVAAVGGIITLASDPSAWVIELGEPGSRQPVDPSLAYWSGLDRFWAILAGYMTLFAIGAMYLKRGSPFSRGDMMQAWEAGVIDTLHQASGIMKVILIISIEMLVFPLYCGLLLDGALLPLFENTTFKSRILFTYNYPLTSIFVHWFVGTGYMFHFALFVSMCRKIMRPGVLYFIRDPDDPEFHPVRDVLERNLTTQLRKILFSAFVYGALVIVCLGGVVWGLYYAIPGVLPIHYSSNEPVLEFPVDLLFYNFLMPLAVKFFKPSDGLHAMYTWWFRKCARGLHLTYFLFGERQIDEEGILQLTDESQSRVPRHKALLLELNEDNVVIPKTWRDTLEGGNAKPNPTISNKDMRELRHKKAHLVHTGQLRKNGRFVRAPASDRVKIPKGQKVFLTVSERGNRKDGNPDTDLYSSTQYQLVYIPPNFRARVFLFILFIWLFAAITGVGFTVAPLVLGRTMFKTLIPAHVRTNDIYAFSIGIYILGSMTYAVLRLRNITAKVRTWMGRVKREISSGNSGSRVIGGIMRGLELLYAYFFLLIVFPLAVSMLMELYVSIPLHTYMNPPQQLQQAHLLTSSRDGDAGRHTVRVIQLWTLGLLYLNLVTRMIASLFPDTRAAIAVRSVMRRGHLKPDVRVLTRAFVIPGTALSIVALFGPPITAKLMINIGVINFAQIDSSASVAGSLNLAMVYRYSYPAAAMAAILMKHAIGLTKVFNRWTAGVRDEAYLIGERLHNFGAATAGSRKAKQAWGAAGGGRL